MRQMYITIIISESDTLVYFVNFNFHTLFYSTFFTLLNKMTRYERMMMKLERVESKNWYFINF